LAPVGFDQHWLPQPPRLASASSETHAGFLAHSTTYSSLAIPVDQAVLPETAYTGPNLDSGASELTLSTLPEDYDQLQQHDGYAKSV